MCQIGTSSYSIYISINNLFKLFMSEVDSWEIYDNSIFPSVHIAAGGKDCETSIYVETTYKTIANYVK